MLLRGLIASFALALAASAAAQSYDAGTLDRPLAELQAAPDGATAAVAVAAIWRQWMQPSDPEQRLLMELGMQEMRSGELADAVATFTRLIDKAPDLPEPWHKRGSVHMLRGELPEAIADFCATLRREPRHFGAYANLGAVRLQTHEPARAAAAFALALKHNPHFPGIKAEMARLAGEAVGELPDDALGCGLRTAGR
ncbi:MAG TPA: tetratricopeptide repeat protein [Reyranella sp.]|nr:tetratricopeptide repeat protein [Reyranella sp.]